MRREALRLLLMFAVMVLLTLGALFLIAHYWHLPPDGDGPLGYWKP